MLVGSVVTDEDETEARTGSVVLGGRQARTCRPERSKREMGDNQRHVGQRCAPIWSHALLADGCEGQSGLNGVAHV